MAEGTIKIFQWGHICNVIMLPGMFHQLLLQEKSYNIAALLLPYSKTALRLACVPTAYLVVLAAPCHCTKCMPLTGLEVRPCLLTSVTSYSSKVLASSECYA